MSIGLMEGGSGIHSCVILVGDGGGGVDTRSTTFSAVEVFVLFAFFGRHCCAPASTNILNWASTGTLFVAVSSIMSHAVATSSSSYPVGSFASGLGLELVGMIDVVRLATTLASLSSFLSNVELTIAKVLGL